MRYLICLVFITLNLVHGQTFPLGQVGLKGSIQDRLNQKQHWQEQLNQTQRQSQRIHRNLESLQQHLDALSGSEQIFRLLRQQQQQLPRPDIQFGLANEVADTRLLQFQLNQLLLNQELSRTERQAWEALQDQLQELLELQLQLLTEQQVLLSNSALLNQQLEDRLFWLPSNARINLSWFLAWPEAVINQVSIQFDNTDLHWKWPSTWQALFLIIIISAAISIKLRQPWLEQQLHYINDKTRKQLEQATERTTQVSRLSVSALFVAALIISPASLTLIAIGFWLAPSLGLSIDTSIRALAFSLFVWQWFLYIVNKSDIAQLHLNWSTEMQDQMRRFLLPFGWVLVLSSPILALAEQQQNVHLDVLGPLVLLLSCSWIAWLFARLLRKLPKVYGSQILQWLLGILLIMLPMLLVILTLQGYYYSSLQLTGRLLATLYVLAGWVLIQSLVDHSLALTNQRLEHERALLEAEHAERLAALVNQDSEMPSALPPMPKLAVAQITSQSKRLANFAILAFFSSLLFIVWGDLFSALGQVNQWLLFVGNNESAISLGSLFRALVILVLTFFLAANLPGLLEATLLSRLQLQAGSSYAITSLFNYGIISIGLVATLSALGVSWEKLQWLVAALTVGLGFGLQEIFANFVSGIILLFERPIRIGDVVTVGNLSGRISQISIRATTITDFDRKEIIVPNKTFVTGELINWSLSDTVTRVVVKVGVAYGSDLRKVKEILLRAAELNDRVLKDPEPQVLFLNFGDSTLDHELRIHVKGLGDRNPAIDEINRYIDQQFKRFGIEIAFRQLDVHLRHLGGSPISGKPVS